MRRLVCLLTLLSTIATWSPALAGHGGAHYTVDRDKLDAALACHDGKAKLDGDGRKEPVLLVHGTGVTREQNWDWNYWRALPRRGFEVCWVQLPKAALGDIQKASEYVARAIEIMHRRTGERIDVLGHSQGGLEPRWAIKYFRTARWVADYISLATPHHGTVTADAGTQNGHAHPAVWQMRTNARFIAALSDGAETPGRRHYTSIYTASDELVQPPSTARLKGGSNILLQDLCPGRPVDHLGIAGDAVTFLLVKDALIRPGPADPARLPADACQRSTMPGASAPPFDAFPDYDGGFAEREPRLKWYAR